MIIVEIARNRVKIEGHAGGEYGQNIVCASISALWYAVTEKLTRDCIKFQMYEKSGYAELVIEKPNSSTDTVLDVLHCGANLIAENYPEKIFLKNI